MTEGFSLYSRFGRVLTVLVGIACAAGLVATALDGGAIGLLRYSWPILLIGFATWAMFWRPAVSVDDAGVVFRNVLRTITIRWPQIRRIDTKYSLTLDTSGGRFSAWAAPAPGRHRVFTAARTDATHLPESSYVNGTVRPGDLVTSDSGAVAFVIRSRWEALRDAGHLAEAEEERVEVRWHGYTAGVLVALLLATGVTFSL